MRDEMVVHDRLQRDRQFKMLVRQGATPTHSRQSGGGASEGFSPLDVVGQPALAIESETLPEDEAPMFVGMLGHNGCREVARNSKKNYRGFIIFNNRQIQYESRIEKNTVMTMITWPDVVDVYSQRPRVRYPGDNGVICEMVFDYLLILSDGTRLAVSVKPESKREAEEARLKQVQSVPHEDFDIAVVVTDRQVTRTVAFNARFIRWARKNATVEEIEMARELTWLQERELFFWQLFDDGSPHHLRRAAIGRLIDLQELTPIDPYARITDYCRLKVTR